MNRNRYLYSLLIVLTILTGLASRYFNTLLPSWVNLYLGDVLWAFMVFFMAGFVFKNTSTLCIAGLALLFSFSIEISQLYHDTWIDSLRLTKLGGLILGYGFLWSDLICYSIGIGVGLLLESVGLKSRKSLIEREFPLNDQ